MFKADRGQFDYVLRHGISLAHVFVVDLVVVQ
jgi:hypothetical protein